MDISEYHNGDQYWQGAGEHVMGEKPTGERAEKLRNSVAELFVKLLIQGRHYDTLSEKYGLTREMVDALAEKCS